MLDFRVTLFNICFVWLASPVASDHLVVFKNVHCQPQNNAQDVLPMRRINLITWVVIVITLNYAVQIVYVIELLHMHNNWGNARVNYCIESKLNYKNMKSNNYTWHTHIYLFVVFISLTIIVFLTYHNTSCNFVNILRCYVYYFRASASKQMSGKYQIVLIKFGCNIQGRTKLNK